MRQERCPLPRRSPDIGDGATATEVLSGIGEVGADEWNGLSGGGSPFLRHEFLLALEDSGSACVATGWEARHLLIRDEHGVALAAMPLYLKHHSWGEFVFDQAWAQAYQRIGRDYYPKLVSAVPFTPVTGPRILLRAGAAHEALTQQLLETARDIAARERASSLHILFPPPDSVTALANGELMLRKDCQYHWHNRGYRDFDDFLARFRSDKRKKVRRERRRVLEAGISFRLLHGHEITAPLLEQIYQFHAATFGRRGQPPYLTHSFYQQVVKTLPDSLVVILAECDDAPVACAICLRDDEALYGRYWGCGRQYDSLHFETCFYQGIEYAIQEGLSRFEPGAQGEHKLRRGFEPVLTWSAHWLRDPAFARAVDRYLSDERAWLDDYLQQARDQLPFHRDARPADTTARR